MAKNGGADHADPSYGWSSGPGSKMDAADIKVHRASHIAIWPLSPRIEPKPGEKASQSSADFMGSIFTETASLLNAKGSPWREVTDLLDQIPSASLWPGEDAEKLRKDEAQQRYGEFVYFYDFIQQSLFSSIDGENTFQPVRVFHQTKIRSCALTITDREGKRIRRFKAKVPRLSIYLFSSGAMIVCAELDFGPEPKIREYEPGSEKDEKVKTWADATRRCMSLADFQTLTDLVRRVYPPYFLDNGKPGGVVSGFEWSDSELAAYGPFSDTGPVLVPEPKMSNTVFDPTQVLRDTDRTGNRNSPIFSHWYNAIHPLAFAVNGDGDNKVWPLWRHVVDERMPLMSCLSLSHASGLKSEDGCNKDLYCVRDCDWQRIGGADAEGTGYFYNPNFLSNNGDVEFYDRFLPHGDELGSGGSRMIFNGYHFVCVGAGWFFDEHIRHHFRRHYFYLMLLAHAEKASILVTSGAITNAVIERKRNIGHFGYNEQKFADDILLIKKRFLEFVHIYRFVGVSNQLQPSEMQSILRKVLHLESIYQEVRDELNLAADFVHASQEAKLAEAAARLNVLALAGVALGLVVGFFGMNHIVTQGADGHAALEWSQATFFGFALILVSVIAMVMALISTIVKSRIKLTFLTLGMLATVGLFFVGLAKWYGG